VVYLLLGKMEMQIILLEWVRDKNVRGIIILKWILRIEDM